MKRAHSGQCRVTQCYCDRQVVIESIITCTLPNRTSVDILKSDRYIQVIVMDR